MRNIIRNILIIFSLSLLIGNSIYSQTLSTHNNRIPSLLRLHLKNSYLHKAQGAADPAVFIGAMVILVATPTVIYENKKVYFGLSRELSLLFGKTGEIRISAEYSFIFRRELKHQFRAVLKYDFLSKLDKGDWFDERNYLSVGCGYFADEEGIGIPAEVSGGFRIGGDGNYFLYPYIKLRHTFMTRKGKPDNTDFSLGMAIGYKPF